VFIVVALLALYLPTLSAPFFADDYLFLDQVRSRSLIAVLTQPDAIPDYVRPLGRQAWFWSMGRISGEQPGVFHVANLLLLLMVVVLVAVIGRRMAGPRAGWIAAAFMAQHYAADVLVLWASGSQDLLAVAGALVALLLSINGRWVLAGVALLAALMSKEIAVVTPLIAVALVASLPRPERSSSPAPPAPHRWDHWRRAWPLLVAVAIWAMLWVSRSRAEARAATGIGFDPLGFVAALFHLPQAALGAEWGTAPGASMAAAFWPTVLLLPVLFVGATPEASRASRAAKSGVLWAILASAPIAAVATMWSAYYDLLALCGVALALGAWLARRPATLGIAILVILGIGSAHSRALLDFARERSLWTLRSHINRSSVEHATRPSARYLAALKRARPAFPPRSTIFFAGLESGVGFQAADGPLLRWAYRDPTLRSYYLTDFTRDKVQRGPVFLFVGEGDSLRDATPGNDALRPIAMALTVSDRLAGARDALDLISVRGATTTDVLYWRAWLNWALGDVVEARSSLARSGVRTKAGPAVQSLAARAAVQRGDTLAAIALMRDAIADHGTDAGAHGLLADLLLVRDPSDPDATIEALAARTLAPRDPFGWRRFAMIQIAKGRPIEGLASLRRYFALDPQGGRDDLEAQEWMRTLAGPLEK
jgi:hypothetical protein